MATRIININQRKTTLGTGNENFVSDGADLTGMIFGNNKRIANGQDIYNELVWELQETKKLYPDGQFDIRWLNSNTIFYAIQFYYIDPSDNNRKVYREEAIYIVNNYNGQAMFMIFTSIKSAPLTPTKGVTV